MIPLNFSTFEIKKNDKDDPQCFCFPNTAPDTHENSFLCVREKKVIPVPCHDMIPDAKKLANGGFDTDKRPTKMWKNVAKLCFSSFTSHHDKTKISKQDSCHKSFLLMHNDDKISDGMKLHMKNMQNIQNELNTSQI